MSATVETTTTALESDDFAETVEAAQHGHPGAVEAVLSALEGAVVAYSHKRAERSSNGAAYKEDMQQEARIAILEALRDYRPQNGVKFTTYAIARIKGAVSDEAYRHAAPGIDPRQADVYAMALRECDGDHDAAEALVQRIDPKRRFSREEARAARYSFAPAASFDTMTEDDAESAQRNFKFRGDRTKSPQDRWAERQGKADKSLTLQRDDVAQDSRARAALVNVLLLPKLSPTQRLVINHTFGTEGAAWLVRITKIGMRGADVTPDKEAIAEAVGCNVKSVPVLKSQALAKLRKVFGDFDDALNAAAVLSV
jgi:RNA polymerase nonessential primary-like sigma factor